MRRAKDISSEYFKADREDRFEYLYDHYGNREGVLLAQKHNFIYLVEGLMMRSSWDGYCKKYNSLSRKTTMKRISGCMDRGEAFDFINEGIILPEDLMQRYKNYCLMKLEFRILSEAMRGIGGADESILR